MNPIRNLFERSKDTPHTLSLSANEISPVEPYTELLYVMDSLLAVDVGLKTGLALFRQDGRLLWYRSQNFGTAERLRRGVSTLMNSIPDLVWLVLEGGGTIADIWEHEAKRREQLLYPREQRTGIQAKHHAEDMARRVIALLGASRPTSLQHDTAEAILIGLWAALSKGWLGHLPNELRQVKALSC